MDSEILGLIVKELNKNGVNLIKHDFSNIDTFSPENVDYFRPGELPQIFDFSEHDKVFEDKIAELEGEIASLKSHMSRLRERCMDGARRNFDRGNYGCLTILNRNGDLETESEKLKQRIAELESENNQLTESILRKETKIHELESKETEKPTKINLNDRIKVKLTPLGAEIYYHQDDELNKKIKANGGKQLEPMMPQIDKDGYTEFQLHQFISLYGEHMGLCKKNVIEPLDIIVSE